MSGLLSFINLKFITMKKNLQVIKNLAVLLGFIPVSPIVSASLITPKAIINTSQPAKQIKSSSTDFSSYIINADCQTENLGWVRHFKNVAGGFLVDNRDLDSEVYSGKGVEFWIGSNSPLQNTPLILQKISNLPIGQYTLKAFATGRSQTDNTNKGTLQLFANEGVTAVTSTKWQSVETIGSVIYDGILNIGLSSGSDNQNNWVAISQVQLLRLNNESSLNVAIESAKKAAEQWQFADVSQLNTAITTAENAKSTAQNTDDYSLALDELNNALVQTKESLYKYASEQHPVDVSYLIQNAQFSNNNLNNWYSSVNPAFKGGFFEVYHSSLDMSQELKGLPNGKYRVKVQARRRIDSGNDAFYLYAVAGNKETTAKITHATHTEGNGGFHLEQNGYEMTYDSQASITYVDATVWNGTLTIGIRTSESNLWVVVNDFSLEYLGKLDLGPLWDEMLEAGHSIDQTQIPQLIAERLNKALETEVSEDNEEEWAAALDELTQAVTLADAVIEPYAETKAKINELKDIQAHSTANNNTIAQDFQTAINSAEEKIEHISSVEEINAIYASLEESRKVYINNATPVTGYGFDMTYKISNPTFDAANSESWILSDYSGQANYPQFGGGSIEFWHCGFKLSQLIKDLPNGEYTLSVQLAATKSESVQIFAGEITNTMSNISLEIDGSNLGATALTFASHRDDYRSYINFNVTEGNANIGIKNSNLNNWVVFDDFRLTYLGEKSQSYFNDMTTKLQQTEQRYNLTAAVPDGIAQRIEQVIADAKGLEATSPITQMANAINELNAINKQLDLVDVNYAKFIEIDNICKDLLSKTGNSQSQADFISICENAENTVNTTTDANDIIIQTELLIEARTAFIKAGPSVMEGESLDVTFMVQNPACTAKEGWATTGTEGNFQCKPDVAVVGEYNGTFLEKWDASVAFTKGQMPIYQNINDLPEGIYELRAAAFRKNLTGNGQTPEYSVALTLNDAFTVINSNVMNYYTVKGYVGSDGIATIGLKAMLDNQANWNGIADVSLWYLGNETAAYEAMKGELADELVSRSDTMAVTRKLREYMLNSAQTSESVTNIESIIDICNEMRTQLTNATEAVVAYQAASEARDKSVFLLDNSKNGDRTTFENGIDRYENEMELADNRTSLYDLCIKFITINQNYMISEGARPINGTAFDLSFLIINRNFESGTNGWDTDTSIENGDNFRAWQDASVNGEYNGKFCERYYNGQNRLDEANGGRAIYQVLTGLPKGMYNIKAAAFGQRVWIGEAYSNNNISLYLNERQEEIKQNVLNYTYIQNVLHQGGDMEFGILMNEQNKYNWIGLGDVQLYYLGNIDLKLYENTEFNNNNESLADVTLMTSNDTERWRTLCLPFDVDAATLNDQMEVREITGFEANGKDCILTLGCPISGISAGKTYAIKMKNNTGSVVLNDVFIPAGVTPESAELENNGVKAIIKGYFAPEELENECCTLYEEQDAFTVPSDHMAKAFQASLKLEGATDTYERILLSVDGIITSIDNTYRPNSEVDVYSVNGIMIKKAVQYENALKDLPKGIYIINGKKVMK